MHGYKDISRLTTVAVWCVVVYMVLDLLYGGAQRDMLTGGAGLDYFIFLDGDTSNVRGLADRVLDFDRSEGDRIHLAHMDANSLTAADDSFSLIGDSAFSGTAGELRAFVALGNA